jgi:hypothetical protein
VGVRVLRASDGRQQQRQHNQAVKDDSDDHGRLLKYEGIWVLNTQQIQLPMTRMEKTNYMRI